MAPRQDHSCQRKAPRRLWVQRQALCWSQQGSNGTLCLLLPALLPLSTKRLVESVTNHAPQYTCSARDAIYRIRLFLHHSTLVLALARRLRTRAQAPSPSKGTQSSQCRCCQCPSSGILSRRVQSLVDSLFVYPHSTHSNSLGGSLWLLGHWWHSRWSQSHASGFGGQCKGLQTVRQ